MDYYDITDSETASEQELLDAVFRAAISECSRGSDIFGLRMQRHSVEYFLEKLATLRPGYSSDTGRIEALFSEVAYIHLTREDKVEQAISYIKAEQSGLWHMASDGTELERLSPPNDTVYDAERIRHQIQQFETDDRDWLRWFDGQQITPLRVTYEALANFPIEVLCQVIEFLGFDRDAAQDVEPDVAKLADATNQIWADRFRAEIADQPMNESGSNI